MKTNPLHSIFFEDRDTLIEQSVILYSGAVDPKGGRGSGVIPSPLLYQLVVVPYSPRFCIYIVFDTKHVMLLILEVISYST